MNQSVLYRRASILILLLVFTLVVWVTPGIDQPDVIWEKWAKETLAVGQCPKAKLCVAFLNVGQGDAILIESPTGTQLLIDGGRDQRVLRELAAVMGFWDRELDYVLATHPDADHIGGLVDVLERYQVKHFIRTDNEGDSPAYARLEELLASDDIETLYAKRGQRYELGGSVILEILFPEIAMAEAESNTSSIVARLQYGDNTFLLTGDSPKSIEEYLVLSEGEHLASKVLKVGHHGSRTSTSELFLDEVRPQYAVISAGKDNQYGHPHLEVTDLLFNKRVETFNTAEVGRVMFVSDGQNLTIE